MDRNKPKIYGCYTFVHLYISLYTSILTHAYFSYFIYILCVFAYVYANALQVCVAIFYVVK